MSLYTKARKHINMYRVKELHEKKITERIALQEQQYLLHFTQNFVPKHYDWRTGKFNENSLSLMQVNDIVLKRLEEIDDALSEGMTTKDFSYLYGGVVVSDIVSINPQLVSSTFAQDLISASGEVTSHMFGPDFPGSHINSIGDFNPQSYSKVDAQATASWNSIQDVTPSGWTPENSYEYVSSASDVVSPGQETDTFKDTHFGEVTISGDTISLSTGDDEDDTQYNTVDIADLNSLFPGVTFPSAIQTPWDAGDQSPSEGSMILRTFKSVSVGDKVSFDYSFTTLETEEEPASDDDFSFITNYRGANREVAGDDAIDDDYGFVLVGNTVQKIVSVLAKDGNNSDFNFGQDGEGLYKPDILQSRFPLTGKYSYTVKQSDIDSHGNLKFFIGVMDTGDGGAGTLESNLDITNLSFNGTRAAAGQLGKTTDAYNLGAPVAALSPEFKNKRFRDKLEKGNKSLERARDLMRSQFKPSLMDIQVGDQRITKINNRTVTDTTRGIEGGKMDGNQITYDKQGNMVVNLPKPKPSVAQQLGVVPLSALPTPKKITPTKQKQLEVAISDTPEVADAIDKFGMAAKTYFDYLIGNLPDTIDNDYLGQEYVDSIFKDAVVNSKGNISVGDNIVGTGGEATYDPETKEITIPFNYDFNTNAEEIAKNPEKFDDSALNKVLRGVAVILGGKYGLDSIPVVPAGYTTALAKSLGGAKQKPGKVTMSAAKVNKINPLLHAQVVGTTGLTKEELYPGQPSPNGFPDTPPPQMAPNGYHPEYGKQAKRYRKLDPVSAVVMNKVGTDDPETNKLVAAAAKKPKVQLVPNTRNKKDKVSEAVWPKGLWSKAKKHW